jgi:hypothetical protein
MQKFECEADGSIFRAVIAETPTEAFKIFYDETGSCLDSIDGCLVVAHCLECGKIILDDGENYQTDEDSGGFFCEPCCEVYDAKQEAAPPVMTPQEFDTLIKSIPTTKTLPATDWE